MRQAEINVIAYALGIAYALFPTYALSSTDAFRSAVAPGLAYAGSGTSARTVTYVLEITGIYRIRRIV
jgi:glycerol dehydrogenase-like iron-containing ADH family enzyme